MTYIVLIITVIFLVINYKITVNNCENGINESNYKDKISQIESTLTKLDFKTKDIDGIADEGAELKKYESNGDKFLLLNAFTEVARYTDSYYIQSGKLIAIKSMAEEWDLRKIYGEAGDLPFENRKYEISTTTTEIYLVKDNRLCKYIADKPRQESAAVSASSSTKDFKSLIDIYNNYLIK